MNYTIKFHRVVKGVKSNLKIELQSQDETQLKEKIREELHDLSKSGWVYEDCIKDEEVHKETDSKKE
jgi:formiminotetrahydrofolate cyclodeaminase